MDRILVNVIRQFNPETAHNITLKLLKHIPLPLTKFEDASLVSNINDLTFSSHIGMAAGFDKNAEVFNSLSKIGFGFVECGTVTPKPQYGNPKPRVFRYSEEEAIINRLGFNNKGIDNFIINVAKRKFFNTPLGINIGPNKNSINFIDDYSLLVDKVHDCADYITINISSPNTENLRKLQNKFELEELISAINSVVKTKVLQKPIFIKINPDETVESYMDIVDLITKYSISGLIISNTTIKREDSQRATIKNEIGGLSGRPLASSSNKILERIYRETKGAVTLIGVGGVSNGKDAYQKIKLGASLVQLYSALTFKGPSLVNEINKDLVKLIKQDGFKSVSEAIGSGI